jgi:uncharacterized protein (UPF0264 family)/ribosome-associated protein YbcJ (S4-like RNA binding protein)
VFTDLNPPLSPSGVRFPQLLVSVRTPQEALDALAGGAGIIDIKEPANGPLGMAPLLEQYQIAATVRASSPVPLSAALGELADWQSQPMPSLPPHLQFAKLGLAGMAREPHWRAIWKQVRAEFDVLRGRPLDWVAVAYADAERVAAPSLKDVLQAAIEEGCKVFLIDTCEKGGPGLVDLIPLPQLRDLIELAHFHQLPVALAGQIRAADLASLLPLGPDIIAVRGAACVAGDRGSAIQADAVATLVSALQTTPGRPVSVTSLPEPEPKEHRKLTLDQFIKLQGWVGTGGQAKFAIQQGMVKVNGEVDTRRRRQMAVGDRVEFEGQTAAVESID